MTIESEGDLEGLRRVGRVVAFALREMRGRLRPGITTEELDAACAEVFDAHGARSAPTLAYGFPGAACISINDDAVHGIPGPRVVQPGDLVKLDVTAELDGYIADAAVTVPMAPESSAGRRLAQCARSALYRALGVAKAGRPISGIGRAVEAEVRRRGFTVMRELGGHGVGRSVHEEPFVPNYEAPWLSAALTYGMVIAIEPVIAERSGGTVGSPDGWTLRTSDGRLSAHWEHTVVITRGRPVVLTAA